MALDQPPRAVRCLKAEGGREVWLVTAAHDEAGLEVLKRWSLTPALALKLLFGVAQPQRQIRGAELLGRAGIATPSIDGSWQIARAGRRVTVQIRMAHAAGRSPLELSTDDARPSPQASAIATALGRLVATLTAAGLFNRDLKLENLIIDEQADPPVVWVLDPVGVRRMRRPGAESARMIERLTVQHLDEGRRIPRWAAIGVLLSAMRPMSPALRRETMVHLRAGRRRRGA